MAFVEDIASLFVTAGIGTVGTNIFYSTRAEVPDTEGPFITLTETAGFQPQRIQNNVTRPGFFIPGAQVLVRGTYYVATRDKAVAAHLCLFGVRNRLIGTTWYREIVTLQQPFDSGLDEKERPKIVFNVLGYRSPYS